MWLFPVLVSILVVNLSFCQNDDILPVTGLVKSEVRKTEIEEYSINSLVNINTPLILNTIKESQIISWTLTQQKNTSLQSDKNGTRLILFNVLNSSFRNQTIRSQFICLPSESNCNSIRVPNFGLDYLGSYSYQVQTTDNSLKNFLVEFNISAYINHLEFKCYSNDCLYNETSDSLTVLSGKSIPIECSIVVAQNSLNTPSAEVVISSDMGKLDHCQLDTNIEQIPQSEVYSYLNKSSSLKIYLYKLSKRCNPVYNKADDGKNFKCELRSVQQPAPVEMQNLDVLESISNKIDVHYDPEIQLNSGQQLNKTYFLDEAETFNFSCPIESNPTPSYEWRIKKALYNKTDPKGIYLNPTEFGLSNKEFLIRKDLEVGFYQFECRARTGGLVNRISDSVTFNLNIKARDVSKGDSKNRTVPIVGGTVGGVVGLVVIISVILLLVRRSKSNDATIEKSRANIYNSEKKENKKRSDLNDESAQLKENKFDQNKPR